MELITAKTTCAGHKSSLLSSSPSSLSLLLASIMHHCPTSLPSVFLFPLLILRGYEVGKKVTLKMDTCGV